MGLVSFVGSVADANSQENDLLQDRNLLLFNIDANGEITWWAALPVLHRMMTYYVGVQSCCRTSPLGDLFEAQHCFQMNSLCRVREGEWTLVNDVTSRVPRFTSSSAPPCLLFHLQYTNT